MRAFCLGAFIVTASLWWGAAVSGQEPDAQRLLTNGGIKTDTASLVNYLNFWTGRSCSPAEISALIDTLSSGDFTQREAATRKLAALGAAAVEALQQAAKSRDLEVSARAVAILDAIARQKDRETNEGTLRAALEVLASRRAPQAVEPILELLGVLDDSPLRETACRALWASAAAENKTVLTAALSDKRVPVQAAAIVAMEAALGQESVAILEPNLADRNPAIRLAAARALIDRQPRRVLGVLAELLAAKEGNIAFDAADLFVLLTGKEWNEALALKPEEDLLVHWQKWAQGAGLTAALKSPLGAERLSPTSKRTILAEAFGQEVKSITARYGRFDYTTTIAGKAEVSKGTLRMSGDHEEGDQRLVLSAKSAVGRETLPNRFRVAAELGAAAGGEGVFHVGIGLGKVRVLFHPGYPGGGFRIERIADHFFVSQNADMGFLPAMDSLHKMTIDVDATFQEKVRLAVSVQNGTNANDVYKATFDVPKAEIGPLDRVSIDRSGRKGGDGLFKNFRLDLRPRPGQ